MTFESVQWTVNGKGEDMQFAWYLVVSVLRAACHGTEMDHVCLAYCNLTFGIPLLPLLVWRLLYHGCLSLERLAPSSQIPPLRACAARWQRRQRRLWASQSVALSSRPRCLSWSLQGRGVHYEVQTRLTTREDAAKLWLPTSDPLRVGLGPRWGLRALW